MILLAKDHALDRRKSFYVQTKVSIFVNFEVDHKMKKLVVQQFSMYYYSTVLPVYFERLSMYINRIPHTKPECVAINRGALFTIELYSSNLCIYMNIPENYFR